MRKFLFPAIALAIPVAFFAALELALRIAGFGVYAPLFVPVPRLAGYLQPNEKAIQRFFARPSMAPSVSIDTTYFKERPDPGTLRLVVQGGSSAAGFPYGKWASPSGMLEQRLRREDPDTEIEVISTAMSAVNSYALLDFAEEIVAVQPDAVLIYAGHNEFLGILGVGSAFTSGHSRGGTLAVMKLRRLRVFRLLETGWSMLRGSDEVPRKRSGTLMARIAGEQHIPYGSRTYRQGLAQFEGNLGALLALYRRAGIPVFLGTLASNERDRAPFIGVPSGEQDEAAGTDHWRMQMNSGQAALAAGDALAATAALERAVAAEDNAALAWYALGQARLATRRPGPAREAFRAARDRDQLRFRAPGAFNDILREQAAAHGATVSEVEEALASASPDGSIGAESMLEHVHPNVRGYFLLADAFHRSLGSAGLIDAEFGLEREGAWRHRPVTRIDALAGEYRLQRLLADWPFELTKKSFEIPPPRTPEEQIAQAWYQRRINWQQAMNRALAHYQDEGRIDEAIRVALNLAAAFHFIDQPQYVAGQLLLRGGDAKLARHYLTRATQLAPRKPENLLALARALYRDGDVPASRATLDRLLTLQPDNEAARAMQQQIR